MITFVNKGNHCSVETCSNPAICRGYCDKHYTNVKRYGKPISPFSFKKPIAEKLESRSMPIPETGCFVWLGSADDLGYGTISYRSKPTKAHRLAYQLAHGDIPDNLIVCHKCDVPSCINVNHLFLGTHADNMRDRDKKGRQYDRTGTKNGRAKLDLAKANEIRQLYGSQKISKAKIGRMFAVSAQAISDVIHNVRWL